MTSPAPLEKRIIGYASELSVTAGQSISFAVSSELDGDYRATVTRLLGGGFDPAAPTLATEPVRDLGRFPLTSQPIETGSCAHASMSAADLDKVALGSGDFTVVIGVQPWLLGRFQTIAHLLGDDGELEVGLTENGTVFARLDRVTATGPVLEVASGWATVVVTVAATGLTVAVSAVESSTPLKESATTPLLLGGRSGGPVPAGSLLGVGAVTDVTFGGSRCSTGGSEKPFDGRLERPAILAGAFSADEALTLVGAPGTPVAAEALLIWEFSEGIDTWSVPGHGAWASDLVLQGAPKRAVSGSAWRSSRDWRDSPSEFSAIHFFPDSLEDCGWEMQASWTVPADAVSGFYALHVTAGSHEDWIPFFVRPSVGGPQADVLVVASSATYFAYANSRFWWEDPIQEIAQDRLVELGPEEQYLLHHPELGLSNYDLHADGTPVVFSSRRRPNLFMRPGHSRSESYASDLYLIAWLEHLGLRYDVVTDEDLHFDGQALLDGYRVVVSGSHPEYLSIAMFDSVRDWVEKGGRYLYTGGNGFTSCVTWGAERPWLMENRTTGRMRLDDQRMHSEAVNQTDGTLGSRMEESGRSPGSLWGVDSVTMGFDRSYPVVRMDDSYRPEFAFAFEGITARMFGGRSLSGGGVIGQEWDNARLVKGAEGHFVLASSIDHSLIPDVLGADPVHHGDVVLFFHGDGVVFSGSSMAWAGALHINNYDNDAEIFMRNILTRFLDPEPVPRPEREPRSSTETGAA